MDQGLQKFSGEEDHVEEDDVEMTGKGSVEVSRVDEDPFEKEMRLANETSAEEVRVSYVNQTINWKSG